MIHYTLLPENEIKKLKREYRTRLVIFMLFFMSCAVLFGIAALAPGYILSYSLEKDALDKLDVLQKSRQTSGSNNMIKELADSNKIINKLKDYKTSIPFSSIISKIISYKPSGVSIRSFDVSSLTEEASSTINAVIQGKASSRESLVLFRDKISSDPLVEKVELPVSDLAKSKDISYSIKISIKQIK